MNFRKYIMLSVTAGFLAMASACSEDDLGPTIFPDVSDDADPTSYTYKFDTWINREYRDVYNLDFKYKMEDVEADMNYNLVPASYNNARDLCLLTKYLWFDAYKELAGVDFLKQYGPRILHLIGSAAINPSSGTEILGLAEGGLKVTLFKVNEMDLLNFNQLNEYYFRTMHHEFGHILHQTKSYPTDFNLLSTGRYDDGSWQNKAIGYVASLGFITPYASSQAREDFAETIANFVTRTDEAMELIKWMAAQGWSTGVEASDDPAQDADKPYYCRYYYADPQNPEDRTYFLSSVEKDPDYRPAVVGMNGDICTLWPKWRLISTNLPKDMISTASRTKTQSTVSTSSTRSSRSCATGLKNSGRSISTNSARLSRPASGTSTSKLFVPKSTQSPILLLVNNQIRIDNEKITHIPSPCRNGFCRLRQYTGPYFRRFGRRTSGNGQERSS